MTESQLDECLAAVASALNPPQITLAQFLAGEPLSYIGLGRCERRRFVATWRSLPGCPVKVLTIGPEPGHKGPRRRYLYAEGEARQFFGLMTAEDLS